MKQQRGDEMAECLRQIKRIAELRINGQLGCDLEFGPAIMQWPETLAGWSDSPDNLTCAYLIAAHRKTAAQLADWMRAAGMSVTIDAAGNVAGRYLSDQAGTKTLMTGSHYDTVRNGGKYDGRLGSCYRSPWSATCTSAVRNCPSTSTSSASPKRKGGALQEHLPRKQRHHRPVRPGATGAAGRRRRQHARTANSPPCCWPEACLFLTRGGIRRRFVRGRISGVSDGRPLMAGH